MVRTICIWRLYVLNWLLTAISYDVIVTVFFTGLAYAYVRIWTEFVHTYAAEHMKMFGERSTRTFFTLLGVGLAFALSSAHSSVIETLYEQVSSPNSVNSASERLVRLHIR
jgi:uncharacterized membrane protein